MSEPVSPAEGWAVLHLFFRNRPGVDRESVVGAVKSARADGHQVVVTAMLGHKADLGCMALGPDLRRLRGLQTALVGAGLELSWSYVSITEVSEYARSLPEEAKHRRLYPQLPPEGKPAFCFYPMSKRRAEASNWYTLPYGERATLMRGHGKVGRSFASRVLQLITGSTGVDDQEWGVTLFAEHPDDLKETVYRMRFDPVSARYAEFGPFFTGVVGELEEVLELVGIA